jgi:putative colanic acid biosynthesis UDP-glucose lipid carrier transferase
MTDFIPMPTRSLVRPTSSSFRWLQIILDQGVVLGLLVLHTLYKMNDFPDQYRVLAVLTALLMTLIYNANGVYHYRPSLFDRFLNLLRAWLTVIVLLVVVGFVSKTSAAYSREVVLGWSVTAFIGQFGAYLFVSLLQTSSRPQTRATLLIGARPLGRHLVNHVNRNKWIADQFVGVLEDDEERIQDWDLAEVPVLGSLDQIHRVVAAHNIRRVYIALPLSQAHLVQPIYQGLVDKHVDVIWAPDIFNVSLLNHSMHELAGVPLISLSETPMIGSAAFTKSSMDVVVAGTALVVLSPIMVLTALLIKLTSPGPVLFKQPRHGWDGRIISVLKFRSMRMHAEASDKLTQASRNDKRITAVGRFIRKTSIDELPQLFNVLAGTMSIVGPRPHAVVHNEYYTGKINAYMTRHRVKPGLTGLAQVNGLRGETVDVKDMADRVQYDLAYINNWSAWLDIKIMLRTAFVLIGKDVY